MKNKIKSTARARVALVTVAALFTACAAFADSSRCGRVALHTWLTTAEFKDISVTAPDGKVLWSGLPDPAKCDVGKEGKWTVEGGVVRQSNEAATTGGTLVFGDPAWGDYTFKAKARKLSGKEGFILHVRERSPEQCIYANYGGWFNKQHGVETRGNFDFATPLKKDCTKAPIKTGRWYDLEMTCAGDKVTMKLDGACLFSSVDVPEITFGGGENKIVVDASKARFPVAEDMWGIFFEDIDLSLDGGVYAELVRNRSFEDGNGEKREQTLRYWLPLGNAEISPNKNRPVSERNPHSARVRGPAGAGIANEGYFGMGVRKGMKYNLSIALRGAVKGPVEVTLEAYGKPALAHARIDGVGADWRTFSATLEANDDDPQARLAIRMAGGGDMYVDCVSLMPADAVCGIFRRDLMDRLAALKPSFVRFPGGCWVEGDTMKDAYRWKQTLGSVWERRTQWNIWRYWSANGVGFHEYLLLCEALGAKPLFCINCGMSHRENVPMDKMDEFVQDALDCIEYANGPTNSVWGARRAAAGHPEPFGLKYLEIGNENGGKAYEERYALMAKAVRARYPDVTLIFDNWRETKRVDDPKDLRDDHFYKMPHDFMGDLAHEYDTPKGDFGIFVGEYAVTRGTTRYGSLRGAIAEAAFMLGLERNQSQVKLAAYAPLFANAQHIVWNPNMIYPTTDGSFVSPSWNVQKLFSENRGTDVVKVDVKTPSIRMTRFRAWKNDVQTNVIDCVQASAMRTAGGGTVLKLVNCAETPQRVEIRGLRGEAARTLFTGPGRDAHNAPFEPEALKEKTDRVQLPASLTLPPLSLSIYTL